MSEKFEVAEDELEPPESSAETFTVSAEELKPLSKVTLTVPEEELAPLSGKEKVPKHNELRDIIAEIGRLEGRSVEVEYPIDNLRLDVVWKSIPTGNPKWVFEVQLGGNFYEALTKLKHAWDKWNSKPFLVTTEEFIERARWLLEGSFHEMKDDARLVNWNEIVKLWEHVKAAATIKKKIKL
ncbi:MAG: hypothetical protein H3Z52_14470 [archaeon]|nr:hypothetical protein [archaeon]